jgi:hypothetical protein
VGVGAPAGTATGGLAGALAGATAGAAFAESVGIALLVEASVAQVAIVTKALLDLSRGAQTEDEKQKDWASIGGAAMGLAIFAVMFLLGARAQRVAAALMKRVGPKLRRWVGKTATGAAEAAPAPAAPQMDAAVPPNAKVELPGPGHDAPPKVVTVEPPPSTRHVSAEPDGGPVKIAEEPAPDAVERPLPHTAAEAQRAVGAGRAIVAVADRTDQDLPSVTAALWALKIPFPFIRHFLVEAPSPGTWQWTLIASRYDLGTMVHESAQQPYDPRSVRKELESRYGAENVTSTTVPPESAKNVGLAGKRHPETGIVFDSRGFPIYDDVALADLPISRQHVASRDHRGQLRAATRELRDLIEKGKVPQSIFSTDQLRAIKAGRPSIPGLTWHHHQDIGRMQLVPRDIHAMTGHIGGFECGTDDISMPRADEFDWFLEPVATDEDSVHNVEQKLGVTFPADYRAFVLRYSEGSPASHTDFDFADGDGIFTAALDQFLGMRPESELYVPRWTAILNERIANGIVPFALAAGGDYLCFDFRASVARPTVIYFHHGREGLSNQYSHVADTFSDFLAMLTEPPHEQ